MSSSPCCMEQVIYLLYSSPFSERCTWKCACNIFPLLGRWYGGIFPARDEQQFPVCSWDVYRAYRIIHRHLQHRISWRLFYPNTCDDPNWLSICRENNEKLPRYYR